MNSRQNMILAKDKIITPDIVFCRYNSETHKYDIKFKTGKVYSYSLDNVVWMRDPETLNPANFRIAHNKKELFGIAAIYVFKNDYRQYWHICFENGTERDYNKEALEISVSCLNDAKSKSVFSYLRQTAAFTSLRAEDGTNLLEKQYNKMEFVAEDKAFSTYANPTRYPPKRIGVFVPIFPFGCNASQFVAVRNALENQFSVVQGPPGTGKTQTILNIIANLLIAGKTVQVVSNNNSATKNVYDKLASPEYGLDFIAAPLGNSENKARFIREQKSQYPDAIKSWISDISAKHDFFNGIRRRTEELAEIFTKQERLAILTQTLQELDIEFTHFKQYASENGRVLFNIEIRRKLRSERILRLWKKCQDFSDAGKKPSLSFRLKCRFVYGIANWRFYNNDTAEIVMIFQALFYTTRRGELTREIEDLTKHLSERNQEKMVKEFTEVSMRYLKAILYNKYGGSAERRVFDEEDLWKNSAAVQKEYPIVLSTTFSARSSLSAMAEFDYVIIDEASQVDVATGALALSCAGNAVIVGDAKQLPNVITEDNLIRLQTIFGNYDISRNYNFAEKSFLQSVCDVIPNIPTTLLREHYRCHPKIANFFNQKFYDGDLLIMTKDCNEENVISVVKTALGNHRRDRINQRQIDVVRQEILPLLAYADEEIGIIAPYNDQVNALYEALPDRRIDIATVHKFQGREKDAIIITTVDDETTNFSDNPNLINVAVSRAKKSLYLVVSGNDQRQNSNIGDLIDYIEYNNPSVIQSKVYSVFDLLYRQYTESRLSILKAYKRISTYDSENLMYALIKDVLRDNDFTVFNVVCHQPLNMLIRDFSLLNEDEQRYAMNNATHLDFLIYNKITKKATIAIEVDGYHYHKRGTPQSLRDVKKNHILERYGIPLLRFATNGSGEKEKLTAKLREILGSNN